MKNYLAEVLYGEYIIEATIKAENDDATLKIALAHAGYSDGTSLMGLYDVSQEVARRVC